MFDHTGIVVTDLTKARRFYDAIAAALGLQTISNGDESFLFGKSKEEPIPYLWIGTTRPSYWVEGSRAGINQMHVAFEARDKAMVHAFYDAALGWVMVGGLGFAAIATLYLTPVAYLLLARFSKPKAEEEARLEREFDEIDARAEPAE